jgi:uncharacterized OB-fold protein
VAPLIYKPYPVPDAETAPFWEAVAAGRLDLQRCRSCHRHVFYPRSLCPHCGGVDLDWVTVSGNGTVYSFTVVHRAPAEFQAEAPYVVALVELEEGVRMLTRLVEVEPAEVRVAMPVEVILRGEPPLPYFRPR